MKIIDRELAYKGHYSINKLTIKGDDGIFEREQFHRGNSVGALVFDTLRKQFVLARQFRPGTEGYFDEIVAGSVEENENPEQTIVREIEEETGYKTDKCFFIGSFYMSPGSSTEKLFLYYCEVSTKTKMGGGNNEENEKIELIYINEIVTPHAFADAKTIIAFYWYLYNKQKGE